MADRLEGPDLRKVACLGDQHLEVTQTQHLLKHQAGEPLGSVAQVVTRCELAHDLAGDASDRVAQLTNRPLGEGSLDRAAQFSVPVLVGERRDPLGDLPGRTGDDLTEAQVLDRAGPPGGLPQR